MIQLSQLQNGGQIFSYLEIGNKYSNLPLPLSLKAKAETLAKAKKSPFSNNNE